MTSSLSLSHEPTPTAAHADRVTDVAIVGAGPYGLSVAAHLRTIRGLDVAVFGEPMSFWAEMPRGMLLRSAWDASYIGFPEGDLTLDRYRAESGRSFTKPVPLDAFIDYGRWFQRAAVPELDKRRVGAVRRVRDGFELELADGDTVHAARVVIAAGIEAFAHRPPTLNGLPPELVTHSSQHRDLAAFAGKRILVIGGGQSALESAALLHESGAEVEVVARTEEIIWLHGGSVQRKLGRFKPLLYAQTDVGPAGLSRLVAVPALFCRLPRRAQERLAHRAIRPAGARWLVDRLANVPITTGRNAVGAAQTGAQVSVRLDDGSERRVDHVIVGTGYRVDVADYDFLTDSVLSGVARVGGYPRLGTGFESTVPRLHFVGAPAARSFGPTMRFVSGSWYAASRVAAHVRRRAHAA
jgi:NADPH-dependent 2,4-dienoyl-CoA reductase/sulfur reductase-like enzyme